MLQLLKYTIQNIIRKKYILKSTVLLIASGTFYSCNKNELNLYPETTLTEGLFYNTETQLIQAVNDSYRQLEKIYDAGGIADIYGELGSDNVYIKAVSGANSWPEDINLHKIRPDNGKLEAAWNAAYNGIFIINNVITHLENTEVEFSTAGLKERLIAEAKSIRALIYYNLVQVWGGVPFPLKVVSAQESYGYLREKKETILSLLVTDLTEAQANLPESYTGTDIGRITKYGAVAILARVYLAQDDDTKAAQALKSIIDSNRYSLDANGDGSINKTDYAHLFQANTKNSKEAIVEVQYLAGQNQVNSTHQAEYAPWDFSFHLPGSTITFRGNGLNTPADDLINEYEAEDPRKDISLATGFTDLQTGNFIAYPYTLKFYDPNYLYPGQNVEIIRYADILLLYAELTGEVSYLNQVRNRVGLPVYGEAAYPSADYPTVALAVEHERRVELAFEFHRFFDLVRTGRAVAVLQSKGIDITSGELLFPIPQAVIDTNPEITQNP
ncbi:MAG: RagB/SusD family nutrient uptake outer membrane protein [Terrimonas sp.]|nr:RagB/SusD family nutrient uptake outer membrane protein [Terrimonas sp.]